MVPDRAGTYKAADLRTVYNIPTFGNLNPSAVAAVFEQGLNDKSDVTKYLTYNGLPQVTVTPVSVDGSRPRYSTQGWNLRRFSTST